jgi:Helix-turn-helix domain
MTLVEAAAKLGIAPDTLRWQIHKGQLRGARKIGTTWWVTPGAVERYRRDHLGQMGPKRKATG